MLRRVAITGASSSKRRTAAASSNTFSRLQSIPNYSNINRNSGERQHQFSTLQAIPQHFRFNQQHQYFGLPSRDDNDDDRRNKLDGYDNNILYSSSAKVNNSLPYTQHKDNNSLTILRQYHSSTPEQRGVAIVLTLGAVAATAKAGQYAVQGYKEWQVASEEERKQRELEEKNKPKEEQEQQQQETSEQTAQDNTAKSESTNNNAESQSTTGKAKEEGSSGKRENFFAKFFNLSVGSKYYEGGFEEAMTRKEAALILGVRESSTAKRIKEAHRKLLILNHPDTGGSTYMAGKINEAKELLLKGKK